jgi:hypothetical protein
MAVFIEGTKIMTEENAKKTETATINGLFKKIKSFQANFTAVTRRFAAVMTFAGSSLFFSGTALAQTQAATLNGVKVEVDADGNVTVYTDGTVKKVKNALTAANDTLKVGDKMEDGTIYAGISPDTGKKMYAAPADAPRMDFNKAAKYAKDLEVGGKKGFRVPSKAELNVLYQNKDKGALKGTFNLTGSDPAGWYWSSQLYGDYSAWQQRFRCGIQDFDTRVIDAAVRCVR